VVTGELITAGGTHSLVINSGLRARSGTYFRLDHEMGGGATGRPTPNQPRARRSRDQLARNHTPVWQRAS